MDGGIGTEDRVLVTGANGFIGATLVEQLLDSGAAVFALARGRPERLQDLLDRPGLTIVGVDLERDDEVRAAIAAAQPTVAFHLAWLTQPGAYLTSIPWNLESVRFGLALLQRLLEQGCARIVGAGTCAEYELGPAVLTEDSPARPSSVYGASKLALATAAVPAAAQAGARLAWARIFYVYGRGEDPRRAFPTIVEGARAGHPPALNKPDQARDFLDVRDVASALMALAGAHGTFNVCSGQGRTLRDLWEQARAAVDPGGAPLSLGPADGEEEPPIVGDPSRLRRLGWEPRHGDEPSFAATVRAT